MTMWIWKAQDGGIKIASLNPTILCCLSSNRVNLLIHTNLNENRTWNEFGCLSATHWQSLETQECEVSVNEKETTDYWRVWRGITFSTKWGSQVSCGDEIVEEVDFTNIWERWRKERDLKGAVCVARESVCRLLSSLCAFVLLCICNLLQRR